MKTCVFTPPHETGILVADIIPYAGSHDTRLGRESSRPLGGNGAFCALTGRAAFLFRRNPGESGSVNPVSHRRRVHFITTRFADPRYRGRRKAYYRRGRAHPSPDGLRTRWTTPKVSWGLASSNPP